MEIKSVNHAPVNFCALKRDPANMSKSLFEAIKDAPAIKAFGEKYDGTLACDMFQSRTRKNRVQLALSVNDIKPVSIKDKLKGLFAKNVTSAIQLKTHTTNEDDFIAVLKRQSSDKLLDIYNK